MAAPVICVPISATFEQALEDRAALKHGAVWWKIEVDDDFDGNYDDITSLLDNNDVNIRGKGSRWSASVSGSASFSLRNVPKVYSEGDLANAAVKISVKVGSASEYIQVFFGYVDPDGVSRTIASESSDTIDVSCKDPSSSRGTSRSAVNQTLYASHKIVDNATPANSLAHKYAAKLGLADSDCDFTDHNYTKPYVFVDRKGKWWRELQDMAAQYSALLGFRYDGKLRFLNWTTAEWNAPNIEWAFDNTNTHGPIKPGGKRVFCNRATTEFENYQIAVTDAQVFKCYDRYSNITRKNAITLASGEYYPVANDEYAALKCTYAVAGESFPIGTGIATPTIGAPGSGADIIYTGAGTLSLESFNGVAGTNASKTVQSADGSQLILKATGGSVEITKIRLRGTAVRILERVIVSHETAGIDEWDAVERTLPGKYAVSYAQADESIQRLVDYGSVARKPFSVEVDFTPQMQAGTIVSFAPRADLSYNCVVEDYEHTSRGSHTQTRTRLTLVQHSTFTPAANTSEQQSQSMTMPPAPPGPYVRVGAFDYDELAEYYCLDDDSCEDQINQAIDAMYDIGGGEVRILPGYFPINGPIIPKANVVIRGSGAGTIIAPAANGFDMIAADGSAFDLVGAGVYDLVVDCDTASSVNGITTTWSDGFVVQNVTVLDCVGYSVKAIDVRRISVLDSKIKNCASIGICLGTTGGSDERVYIGQVSRCVLSGEEASPVASFIGIQCNSVKSVVVSDNIIDGIYSEGNASGLQVGVGSGCTIVNNEVRNFFSGLTGTSERVAQAISIIGTDNIVKNNVIENLHEYSRLTGPSIAVFNYGSGNTFKANFARNTGSLLLRGNCESTTEPSIEASGLTANATFARDATEKANGTYSYKFTKTNAAGAGNAIARLVDTASTTDMHGMIPGRDYRFRGKFFTPSGGLLTSEVYLVLRYYSGGVWTYATANPTGFDAFELLDTGIVEIPYDATGAEIYLQIASPAEINEFVYVDDLELVSVGYHNEHGNIFEIGTGDGVIVQDNSWQDAA